MVIRKLKISLDTHVVLNSQSRRIHTEEKSLARSHKWWMPVFLLSLLIPVLPITADAQVVDSTAKTTVLIQKGVNGAFSSDLKTKVETLLLAINRWQMTGEDSFPNDPGISILRSIVSRDQLVSPFDTLSSRVITNGSWFEVTGIYLTPKSSSLYDVREFICAFNSEEELIDFREVDVSFDFDRIGAFDKKPSTEQESKVKAFWEEYERVFEEKDKFYLNTLFASNAQIIVGSSPEGEKGSTIKKVVRDTYLDRLQTRTLTPRNTISIDISEMEMFLHPDTPGLVATTVRQQWNSTAYNENGYLFMVVDISNDIPLILYREWSAIPFILKAPATKFPDPVNLTAKPSKVTFADSLEVFDGYLALSIHNETSTFIPVTKFRDLLEKKQLEIEGVTLNVEKSFFRDNKYFVSYSMDDKAYKPSASLRIHIGENNTFFPREMNYPVYAQHINDWTMMVTKSETAVEKFNIVSPISTLDVELKNTDSVLTRIKTEDGKLLYEQRIIGEKKQFEVFDGRYIVELEKQGFYPQVLSKDVLNYRDNTLFVIMRNIAQTKSLAMTNKKKGFWEKYRLWILGSSAFLAGGTAAALIFSDDPGALIGLPNPPGRPGIGN